MNSEISKLIGAPLNVSEGQHTRSDSESAKRPDTVSLGDGKFLPDTSRLSYGTAGVAAAKEGRYGPTGRA
jgi:hypothetical protein